MGSFYLGDILVNTNNNHSNNEFNKEKGEENLFFSQIRYNFRQNDLLAQHCDFNQKELTPRISLLYKRVKEKRYSQRTLPGLKKVLKKETIRLVALWQLYKELVYRIPVLESSSIPVSLNKKNSQENMVSDGDLKQL